MQSIIIKLTNNNYREYVHDNTLHNCDKFFQKRVKTLEGKTQYFINAYIYDFTKYNLEFGKVTTSFEMDFYDDHNRSIRTTLSLHDFDSIQDFEEYVKNLFIRNNFVNDIHNE
jgi:hypothetical protein